VGTLFFLSVALCPDLLFVAAGEESDNAATSFGSSHLDRLAQDYVDYQEQQQHEQQARLKPTYNVLEPMLRSQPPKSCASDKQTHGYSDLNGLRVAIEEANRRDAESVLLLDRFDREYDMYLLDPNKYAEPVPPVINLPSAYVICPGANLKSRRTIQPIEINATELSLVCDSCSIEGPGTHFTFGSRARGVSIKGITFKGATASSLTFPHHGAEVTLEDCFFENNLGSAITNSGAIGDLNSTSSVSFFRCEISDTKQVVVPVAGGTQQVSSSLTIRN